MIDTNKYKEIVNMVDQEMLKESLKPIIELFDQCPTGVRIPSDWKAPQGYDLEVIDVEGTPVEHLVPDNDNGKVILQFHGGGFLFAYLDCYRETACMYSKAANGAQVYSVDYRVAPNYRYPCAHEDCLGVYRWLLGKGVDSQDIIIVGDSAGGNLALSVTLQIRDQNLPLPKAVIAMSPWASLAGGYKSRTENYEKDIILGKYGLKLGKITLDPTFYTEAGNFTNPYVSPAFGDYNRFPDLLIQVGSYEFLFDDAKTVATEAEAKGVNVTFSVYEEMSHVFQFLLPNIEETKKAWEEIHEFLCSEFELA